MPIFLGTAQRFVHNQVYVGGGTALNKARFFIVAQSLNDQLGTRLGKQLIYIAIAGHG